VDTRHIGAKQSFEASAGHDELFGTAQSIGSILKSAQDESIRTALALVVYAMAAYVRN
jgi:hypothetical protein